MIRSKYVISFICTCALSSVVLLAGSGVSFAQEKKLVKQLSNRIVELENKVQRLEQRYTDLVGMIGALESLAKSGPSAKFTSTRPTSRYRSSPNTASPYSRGDVRVNQLPRFEEQGNANPSAPPANSQPKRKRVGFDNDYDAGFSSNLTSTSLPFGATDAASLYSQSYSRLIKRDYTSATKGFEAFMQNYKGHKQAGNAQYWLGETYFVQKKYKKAADAFLRGYRNHKRSNKAPNSLLKLAVTLSRLGQKQAACSALNELDKRYPNPSQFVIGRAQAEKDKLNCF